MFAKRKRKQYDLDDLNRPARLLSLHSPKEIFLFPGPTRDVCVPL